MYYWSPADAKETEVDFLLKRGKEKVAIEVKATKRLRDTHLKGLKAIAELPGLKRRLLVYMGTVIVSRIKTNSEAFDKSVLHQKYVVERCSIRQIAGEFASSKHFVRRALSDFGIPLRGRWRNPYRKNNLPYGKKCRKCTVVDHPGEQRIIQLILRMHEQGVSNSAIARVLVTMVSGSSF